LGTGPAAIGRGSSIPAGTGDDAHAFEVGRSTPAPTIAVATTDASLIPAFVKFRAIASLSNGPKDSDTPRGAYDADTPRRCQWSILSNFTMSAQN